MHFNPKTNLKGLFLGGGAPNAPRAIHRFRPPSLYRVKGEYWQNESGKKPGIAQK